MPSRALHRRALTVLAGLALGALGGLGFMLFGLPAAMLSGAMAVTAVAVLAGAPLAMPNLIRDGAFVVLGVVVGSAIDAETLEALPHWPVSLAALAVAVALLMILAPMRLTRAHGVDPLTARLCAIPGALSYVIALTDDLGADGRRVAILQTLRLVILMIVAPAALGLAMTVPSAPAEPETTLGLGALAMLLALSALAAILAQKAGAPAPMFMGPMAVSGALFASGVVEGRPPTLLIDAAFLVTGVVVGLRFRGTELGFLWRSVRAGVDNAAIGLGLTTLAAWPVAAGLGLPFLQVWLAFAPGGFDTMTALAFALDVDPAFVAGHQLLRFLGLSLTLPFLFRKSDRAAPRR